LIIGILGANGFVGEHIYKKIVKINQDTHKITRENYLEYQNFFFDILINAAMPSKRFWAKNNPKLDYKETVDKTNYFISNFNYKKFIHISSISSRCQANTVYGKNKKLSEDMCIKVKDYLIIRLGPLFGENLSKGVIIDMVNNSKVFADKKSKYAFTSIEWFSEWLKNNLHLTGLLEVGPNNYITLESLSNKLGSSSEFEGDIDDQIIVSKNKFKTDAINVLKYARKLKNEIS
jgi:hypothetical protein